MQLHATVAILIFQLKCLKTHRDNDGRERIVSKVSVFMDSSRFSERGFLLNGNFRRAGLADCAKTVPRGFPFVEIPKSLGCS